jgi:hypothetical protein
VRSAAASSVSSRQRFFNAYFELPIGLFLCALLVIIVLWRELKPAWRGLLVVALLGYGYRLAGISLDYVDDYRRVLRNFYGQLRVADISHDEPGDQTHDPAWSHQSRRTVHLAASTAGDQPPTIASNPGLARRCVSIAGGQPLKIGVLGLGAGTLATYGRQGDEMRMYEINEQVLDLARNDFSYLGDSAGDGSFQCSAMAA